MTQTYDEMRGVTVVLFLIILSVQAYNQTTINFDEESDRKLYIKLYGHIDYNHKLERGKRNAGILDVHRLVTLFGYQFSKKTQFISEIEVEHANEIFIEQAFVRHRLIKNMNLKAGLILIPMGMVNEQHEPTFFYSVERPLLDKRIIPSTWREVGIGITGLIPQNSLKYQLYLVNNPISFVNGAGRINAASGIRGGRQKGIKSIVTTFPGLSGQIEYFGFEGAKVGLSLYHGKTNTDLFQQFPDQSEETQLLIDSTTLKVSMASIHSTYGVGDWTFRFQYVLAGYKGNSTYNHFTGNNVPDLMHGFYGLVAYDFIDNEEVTLAPFLRFSHLNNHLKVPSNLVKDNALEQNILTMGINYKPNPAVVFKIDYQFYNLANGNRFQQFNSGVGVWF